MISFVFNPFTGNFDEISTVDLAPVGASPNADAATLTGDVLNLEPASTSFPGVVTTLTQSFSGQKTITNTTTDSDLTTLVADANNHTTTTLSNTIIGMRGTVIETVDVGAVNDKAAVGQIFTVQRGNGTDAGNLHNVTGTNAMVFINSDTAGTTDEAVGFDFQSFSQSGTLTDLFDFRSERIPAGPGIFTNHYGLYIKHDSTTLIKNWVAGSTLLGKTSFSTPSAVLEVAGDLALDGATSGTFIQQANAVTTDYTVSWPAAQGASSTALVNDGAGNLTWTSVATGSSTFPQEQYNLGFGAGADGSNNLIIVSTQSDGVTAPTGGSPVKVGFKFTPGASQYGYTEVSATAQQTLTVPVGATLGLVAGIPQTVYLYMLGNTELAVSASIFDDYTNVTTTTISNTSNSYTTLYSGASRSDYIRLIGQMIFTLVTPGTWLTPDDAAVVSYGITKPTPTNSALSSNSGTFSTTSATFVPVTGVSISVASTGRPLHLLLQASAGSTGSYITATSNASNAILNIKFVRDGSVDLNTLSLQVAGPTQVFWAPSSMEFYDTPTPGIHTYDLYVQDGTGAGVTVESCQLFGIET